MKKTKNRIVAEAEKLFSQKGYASTSIREIISAAKVNLSAIHYHFGSKESLFLEIVRLRLEGVNQRRAELLNDILEESKNGKPSARNIVTAFLSPITEMHRTQSGSKQFSMMLGRAFSENPELKHKIFNNFFREISSRFIRAFRIALPLLSEEEIYWRFHFMISTMVGTLMAQDRLAFLSNGLCKSNDIHEMIDRLIDFVVAGIENNPNP